MKIKLSQIVVAVESKTLEKLEAATPPWSVRMACARLTDAVLAEYGRFVKLRNEAVKKYGVQDDEKRTISVVDPRNTPENIFAFNDALDALLESEVELPVNPLSATLLGSDSPLTIGDVRCLGPLLVD